MISAPSLCRWAGPIIDLLLDYVGHVTLCSRLMEHLNSYSEWSAIKDKAGEPITSDRSAPVEHRPDWFYWLLRCSASTAAAAPLQAEDPSAGRS